MEVYLLGDFALRGAPIRRVVEVGAGSGVLALLLAAQGVEVIAIEREPAWIPLLTRSVTDSGLAGRVAVVEGDARTWRGEADLVVTNPPWFRPDAGPASPDPWRAAGRTARHGSPEELVAAGLRIAPAVVTVGPRVPDVGVAVRRAASGRLRLAELRVEGAPGEETAIDVAAAYRRFRGP